MGFIKPWLHLLRDHYLQATVCRDIGTTTTTRLDLDIPYEHCERSTPECRSLAMVEAGSCLLLATILLSLANEGELTTASPEALRPVNCKQLVISQAQKSEAIFLLSKLELPVFQIFCQNILRVALDR